MIGGFESRQGLGIFLFRTASRPVQGLTQPSYTMCTRDGVERPGREAEHSPPFSAEVKNEWGYSSTPPIRLHYVVLG